MTRLALALLLAATSARAADLAILPSEIRLDGPKSARSVIVEARDGAAFLGDEPARAAFRIDNPAVATVTPDGTIAPVGDGTATLTAEVDGRQANAKVHVRDITRPFAWSFRN